MQRLNTVLLELQDQYPCEIGAVFVATLTGLRISEVLSLEWSNVHLETSRATLSRTKTEKRIVVLVGPVKDILAGLPRIEGNESCFPSVYDRRGMTATTYKSARRIFAMACERANLHDGRLHDLRRSFLTMLAGAGFGAFAIRDAAGQGTDETADARSGRQHSWLAVTAPLGYSYAMQTVVETPTFMRQADKLFSEDEKRELIDFLAKNPLAGDTIPGTSGIRKLRFATSGRGKRGGTRVIYYYLDEAMPVYALLAYTKATKTDLTPDEKRVVSALAAALKATRKESK